MAAALRPSALRQIMAGRTASSLLRSPKNQQAIARPSWTMQRAAFRTSAPRAILPPLPQRVEGTVNDPAPVPESSPSHGSYHWSAERLVSVALIPITVAPFAAGSLSPLLDGTLISLIIVHTFIGFQSVIADYLPKYRVPISRRLADWGNVFAVFVVGWGWYEFETNDVGLVEGVRRVWKAGATAKPE